jgi:hypothetical protein
MTNTTLITSVALLCGAVTALATDGAAETQTAPDYRPLSLRIEGGTTGIGGAASWRFGDHFGLRAGCDYFTYNHNDEVEGISYDAKLRLQSEPLTLDWYPSKTSSFRVSLGLAFNQNRLTGTGTPTSEIEIGDNTYTPAEVGTLNLRVEQQPVNAYLSIGGNLFYFDKAHHWALAGELGVMFTGDAKVGLNRTGGTGAPGLDADIEKERQQIEDKLNDFKFWPVAKLSLNYSF